jgi:response regulator RpfG family c-di-GMP phosphodiesterase
MEEGSVQGHPGQILVVDDEETVRRSIQKRLEKEGYRVIAIDNATDGLKIFETVGFDAVISDIRMREMNGVELLARIRALKGDVPVIMVTGDPALETAQECLKHGAYDYITKPVERDALLQTVRRAVERKRLDERLNAYRRELEERVQEQTRIIRALFQMANELNALETLDDVLRTVTEGVHRHTRSERVIVLLRQKKEESLTVAHGMGVEEHRVRGRSIPLQSPILKDLFGSEEALRLPTRGDGSALDGILALLGETPRLGVGLVHLNDPFGVILAGERALGGDYTEDEIRILSYIGDSASVAINNQMVSHRLRESYFQIIEALAFAVEAKDPSTRGHSERVRKYAVRLAGRLGLCEEETLHIANAAILHDIGKVEVSRSILQKPDRLTEDEYGDMKDHSALGEIMVEGISFLKGARALIRHHHERWDGQGYPDGLSGEETPLGARIIAVADTYDALTSPRPYRNDTSKERAILQLRKEKETHLDPRLVEAFISMMQRPE